MKVIPTDKTALLPDRYQITGDGLCLVQSDKDGKKKYKPLANFFAWIRNDVIKDDGAERLRFYEVEGVLLSNGKALPPILVPASEFDGMKWLSMWGPEPNVNPGNNVRDTVRHAIQSTAKGATQERIFAHLGWVKLDGKWVYLHAGGAIGASDVKVELDPRLKNYALATSVAGTMSAMASSVKLLDIAPTRVTYALWALVYLSVLCEPLRHIAQEPKFLVWLHGYTGSRKTAMTKLFLCHFGSHLEHPPLSFKDTANSVEKRGFDAADTLLLVDDYHPTASTREAHAMRALAQQLLRAYGDRIGRGRMRQDTSLRPDYPPRGMVIVTAEDMVDGGSSVARLFPVELKPTDVDLPKLTDAQRNAHKLSEAMAGYVAWVGQSMNDGDNSDLRDVFYERRDDATRLNVHGKLVEAASWLYLGLYNGLKYAVTVAAMEPQRRDEILREAWDLFLGVTREQGEQVSEIKATTRFLTIVSELLANGTFYTEPIRSYVTSTSPDKGTKVGWHDANYFYFLPEVLYNNVSRFLVAQDSRFPITSQILWKQLAEEGIIETETSAEGGKERRHNTRKKVIDGDRSRKLWIRAEVLREKAPKKPDRHKPNQQKRPGTANELFP